MEQRTTTLVANPGHKSNRPRSGKTTIVLICLLLLGGASAIIHAGIGNTSNKTGDGLSIEAADPLSHQPNQSQNQPQATITTSCTDGIYISSYGDTLCASETSSTATTGTTAPCANGIKTSPYGDIVCRPTTSRTTTLPICHPDTQC